MGARSVAFAICSEVVKEAPTVMGTGVGAYLGWVVAVGFEARPKTIGYWSPWSIICLAIAVVGVVLWAARAVKERKGNPEDVTVVTLHTELRQLRKVLSIQQGRRQRHVSTAGRLTYSAPGTFTTAEGVGPVLLTLPPGKTVSLPTGATLEIQE